jgi:hypothetical protein
MGEFQEVLDFPPTPKLGWDGKLDPAKATAAEMHGQQIFFGKGQYSSFTASTRMVNLIGLGIVFLSGWSRVQ